MVSSLPPGQAFEVKRIPSTNRFTAGHPLAPGFATELKLVGTRLIIRGEELPNPVTIDLAKRPKIQFHKGILGTKSFFFLQEHGEPPTTFQFSRQVFEQLSDKLSQVTQELGEVADEELLDPFGRRLRKSESVQRIGKRPMVTRARIWSGDLQGGLLTLTNQRLLLLGTNTVEFFSGWHALQWLIGFVLFIPFFILIAVPDAADVIPGWLAGISALAAFCFGIVCCVGLINAFIRDVKHGDFISGWFNATRYGADLAELQSAVIGVDETNQRCLHVSLAGGRYLICYFGGSKKKQDVACIEWLVAIRDALVATGRQVKENGNQAVWVEASDRIRVVCSACGYKALALKEHRGKRTKCPACKALITIP